MKRFRLTIILLVVFVALGAYVWLFERGQVSGPVAWRFDAKRIRRIELTSGGETTVVERAGKAWRITRPISARADRQRMEQLLGRVAKVEVRRSIHESKDLKVYGLAKPVRSLRVALAGGGVRELQLGDKTPDGSAVYAKEKGGAKVLLVDASLLDDVTGGVSALRDRTALAFELGGVQRIALRRPDGTVALEKRGKQWRMVAPIATAADPTAVDNLLASLGEVQATSFPAESAPDLSRYGLAAPRLVIEVTSSGRGKPKRLSFGADAGGGAYYAKNSVDPAVMVVPESAFDQLNRTATDLRSKQIAELDITAVRRIAISRGGQRFEVEREGERWMLTSPHKAEADAQTIEDLLWELSDLRAEGFVDNPGPLVIYGMDPPQVAVTIYLSGRKQPLRIWFGGATPSSVRPSIYVRSAGPTIYETSSDMLARLPSHWMGLRNLTLLSYEPGDITRLRAVYAGKTVGLERKDEQWRLLEPERRRANPERVENLLLLVEKVRAERFINDVAEYGLPAGVGGDKGTLKLTVEATGQKPKTLGAWESEGETRLKLDRGGSVFQAAPGFLKDLTDAVDAVARGK